MSLGLGVLINRVFATSDQYESAQATVNAMKGKTIAHLELQKDVRCGWKSEDVDALVLGVAGGPYIRLWDDGQSCCEVRHMHTDDDLASFLGETLVDITVDTVDARVEDEYEEQFLRIHTTGGTCVFANYVDHNGYYGGFSLKIEELDPATLLPKEKEDE